jgi:hypothetical protein
MLNTDEKGWDLEAKVDSVYDVDVGRGGLNLYCRQVRSRKNKTGVRGRETKKITQ